MTKKSSSKDRKSLIDWIDVLSKTGIAIAGLSLSYIGYIYQKSSTASELLLQQEKGDTEIRAQMFGKITERLMKPKEGQNDRLIDNVLLAQLLALNFHELIELKPLMISLDNRLKKAADGFPANRQTDSEGMTRKEYRETRDNLRSIARRIRDRQLSSLLGYHNSSSEQSSSNIHYISIGLNENPSASKCVSEKDIKINYSNNICFREPTFVPDILEDKHLAISVTQADWLDEKFSVSMQTNIELPKGDMIKSENIAPQSLAQCHLKPSPDINVPDKPGLSDFEITNYDLPFTDNTLKSDGRRYAVFIDKVCFDKSLKENQDGSDKDKMIGSLRIGLLYFPDDYYPSRERPVSYTQLRKKLSWEDI
ncbi:hypothetical protein [Bacterioplanoides sp.]|uniref:hypothetical protein n=1 Tax=Bacterioplanoides sp. TaxID=2066072 RepID=UPI003B0095B2